MSRCFLHTEISSRLNTDYLRTQALGQCSSYLATNFPGVPLQKTSSTGIAAQMLLSDDETEEGERAAICSSICVDIFEGLEVIASDIQDVKCRSRFPVILISRTDKSLFIANFTRFFVLSNSTTSVPPLLKRKLGLRHALVRVSAPLPSSEMKEPSPTSANRQLHLVLSTLLSTFTLPIIRIDRRPAIGGAPFDDVYFVELEELGAAPDPKMNEDRGPGDDRWKNKIGATIERLEFSGLKGTILGLW